MAEGLSPRFWEATLAQRSTFERLGFACCFYSRLKGNLNPSYLDEGAVTYLHPDRSSIGTLVYSRIQVTSPLHLLRETTVVGFTAAFATGSLSFTNSKKRINSLPGRQTVFVQSDDPGKIYERFVSRLRGLPHAPRVFTGCNEVRQWLDACRLESFEAGVARGLYVRMTDGEVEDARRKMHSKLPPPVPK